MSELLFKSICFDEYCNNQTDINWHHETCSSSSNEYLNDNGYIRCSECGSIWPLLMTKFNCNTHSNINAISETDYYEVISCVASFDWMKGMNARFRRNLLESLKNQAKKFGSK